MPCYATAVLNADNSQDPLKNDRQRSGDNNKKEKSDTCNTDLFCRSLSVIEWIFSGPKSAAAKLKGWSLEYDHDSKSRITWSFFSLANRQILYEIPMITVMWLYLVASSYLSFFLRRGLNCQDFVYSLAQISCDKKELSSDLYSKSVYHLCRSFLHDIYVEYCVWGGIMIRYEGVFPVDLVREQFLSWICASHFSRQLIQRTVSVTNSPCKVGSWLSRNL